MTTYQLTMNELFYNNYILSIDTIVSVYNKKRKLVYSGIFNNCPEKYCDIEIISFNIYEAGIEFMINIGSEHE